MRFFVDTNILIYTRDPSDSGKQQLATRWLTELARREIAVVNLQVLNELCHVSLRKLPHIPFDELRDWINELRAWGDTVVDNDVMEAAWSIRSEFRFSWFDCLLLSAADHLGCTHFLSEDLSHGTLVRSTRIVHPFSMQPNELFRTS